MAEQNSIARVTKSFMADRYWSATMLVLAVFAREKGSIGLTEEEIGKKSGIGNDALGPIKMMEDQGFVRSFICQEGTSGPYARRYTLISGAEIKFEISRPT